jgi:protein O-GlcNAc transferase
LSPISIAAIHEALRRGAWLEARTACEQALALDPARAEVHHALGMTYCGEGAFAAAVAPLEAALALETSVARARALGAVFAKLARWHDVWRVLSPVADRLDPTAQALYLSAALETGNFRGAVGFLEERCSPAASSDPDLLCDFARALCTMSRFAEAQTLLLRCLDGPAPLARAHDALATLYTRTGCGDLSHHHAAAYVGLQPASPYAQIRFAAALSQRGRLAEARIARCEAVRLGLEQPSDWTSAIHMMLCDSADTGVDIARVGEQALRHITSRPRRVARVNRERLRVGYLSPEFEQPPGSYFLEPFLLAHDRARVEVFLYDTRRLSVGVPSRPGRLGEHVREVGWMTDDALLELVEADGIDVLVELSAHFPDNRVTLLAQRAAAIQATLPQCPATTGCREVDYLFTDRWTSPPGTEPEYVERLHYVDSGCVIFAAPEDSPDPCPPPSTRDGIVTFGLLQRLPKLGADVWDAISTILRETPRSRLLLHNSDPELGRPESETSRFLRAQLEIRGIDPGRLRLVGAVPRRAHLELVREIDIALDTWPYSGTTTTCECLWMGVPVVTLTAQTHASRVSAGLLRRMGLDELVATDVSGYMSIATELASDVAPLAAWRQSLRPLMIARGLTDGRALAGAMESAYEQWVRPAATWA